MTAFSIYGRTQPRSASKKITFVVWKWFSPTYRTIFEPRFVNVFAAMLDRHYRAPYRLVCITDDPRGVKCETFPLWTDYSDLHNPCGLVLPNCYRRLKLFSGETTRAMGIADGERVVSFDLDAVLLSDLTPMFAMWPDADFVAWKGIGTYKPVVYNGSLFSFLAGRMEWLWKEFDPVHSPEQTRAAHYFGSDQAWMSLKLNGTAPGWDICDGVYSFARDIQRKGLSPADNARIVFFNGKRKPWEPVTQAGDPWIAKHWRM